MTRTEDRRALYPPIDESARITNACFEVTGLTEVVVRKYECPAGRQPQMVIARTYGTDALECLTGAATLARMDKPRAAARLIRPAAEGIWRAVWATQASTEELVRVDNKSEEAKFKMEKELRAAKRGAARTLIHADEILDTIWVKTNRICRPQGMKDNRIQGFMHSTLIATGDLLADDGFATGEEKEFAKAAMAGWAARLARDMYLVLLLAEPEGWDRNSRKFCEILEERQDEIQRLQKELAGKAPAIQQYFESGEAKLEMLERYWRS